MFGKKKNEAAGVPIKELVGLKAKMYSSSIDVSSECKKAKRVNRNFEKITHNQHLRCFVEPKMFETFDV